MNTYFKERHIVKSTNYLLSSILKCPECGGKMSGTKSRYKTKKGITEQQYYVCTENKVRGKHVCNINSVKVDKIDREVLNFLIGNLSQIDEVWATKIVEVLKSDDLLNKKRLLGKLIDKIDVDLDSKTFKFLEYKYEESLFEFLGMKYSKKLKQELKRL